MSNKWQEKLDPNEVLDFEVDFAAADDPVLDEGEEIVDFEVAVTAQAALYGLTIKEDGAYAPSINAENTLIKVWLTIDEASREDPVFLKGIQLGVQFTITTSSNPARTRQRTFYVTVRQL